MTSPTIPDTTSLKSSPATLDATTTAAALHPRVSSERNRRKASKEWAAAVDLEPAAGPATIAAGKRQLIKKSRSLLLRNLNHPRNRRQLRPRSPRKRSQKKRRNLKKSQKMKVMIGECDVLVELEWNEP